jgi:hypothetical protein
MKHYMNGIKHNHEFILEAGQKVSVAHWYLSLIVSNLNSLFTMRCNLITIGVLRIVFLLYLYLGWQLYV